MPRCVTIDINLFHSCNQIKSLCSKFQDLLNSEILLPQNTPKNTFFGFPDHKENLRPLNIYI